MKCLEEMKEMNVLDLKLSIKSALKQERAEEMDAFAKQIADAL